MPSGWEPPDMEWWSSCKARLAALLNELADEGFTVTDLNWSGGRWTKPNGEVVHGGWSFGACDVGSQILREVKPDA